MLPDAARDENEYSVLVGTQASRPLETCSIHPKAMATVGEGPWQVSPSVVSFDYTIDNAGDIVTSVPLAVLWLF